MRYSELDELLRRGKDAIAHGPLGVILAEDGVELGSTIRHHLQLGFTGLLVLMPDGLDLPGDLPEGMARKVHRVRFDTLAEDATERALNTLIPAVDGRWLYYCYNAEYLFYPFCETRSVREMLDFHSGERRDAMLTFVVDLYAADLARHPDGVDLESAMIDSRGYFALGRDKERQLDFFGGLRGRFEEHVPPPSRRIDRVGLFRARRDLRFRPDHTFSDEEYNTYACPWHNNLTAVIASFRTAKALRRNPGSARHVNDFRWHGSVPFAWHSRQLLDLGLMEPGQWF